MKPCNGCLLAGDEANPSLTFTAKSMGRQNFSGSFAVMNKSMLVIEPKYDVFAGYVLCARENKELVRHPTGQKAKECDATLVFASGQKLLMVQFECLVFFDRLAAKLL